MPRTLEIRTRLSRVEHWRHLIEVIAIVGAGLWALYVFVYQEKIKPNLDPPELQGTLSVEHWNLPDNRELIKTILLTKNNGVTPLRVGVVAINVYGVKYGLAPPPHLVVEKNDEYRGAGSSIQIVRSKMLSSTIFVSKIFGGRGDFSIDPGDSQPYYPSNVVRKGEYDAVIIEYGACYQRQDDHADTPFHYKVQADGAIDLRALRAYGDSKRGVYCDVLFFNQFAI